MTTSSTNIDPFWMSIALNTSTKEVLVASFNNTKQLAISDAKSRVNSSFIVTAFDMSKDALSFTKELAIFLKPYEFSDADIAYLTRKLGKTLMKYFK